MDEQRIPNPAPYPGGPPTSWSTPPPPSAPPPLGPPPRQGRDASIVIVAVAVVFAVLVAAGIGWAVVRSNDRDPQTTSPPVPSSSTVPSTSPPSSTTSPSSTSPITAPPATLEAALPELIAFVERERGHRFRTPPVVKAIAAEEFDAKLRADLARDKQAIADEQLTYRALGLIEPDTDLAEVYDRLIAASALGFYDPDTKELYVEGEDFTPLRRAVVVHELTHALDDQYFDLGRQEAMGERPDESAFGFLSLIEGSAKRVESAYRRALSAAERSEIAAEEAKVAGGIDLLTLPLSLIFLQQIPYIAGEVLAQRLVGRGGNALLDRSFQAPPATSEQVLDPARYDSKEPALALAPPSADAAAADQGAFGSIDLQITLIGSDVLGALDAPKDQSGWGGGSYVSWPGADGKACVRFRVVGDTDEDTARFRGDLVAWAADNAADVATVDDPAVPNRPVLEVTRCA